MTTAENFSRVATAFSVVNLHHQLDNKPNKFQQILGFIFSLTSFHPFHRYPHDLDNKSV